MHECCNAARTSVDMFASPRHPITEYFLGRNCMSADCQLKEFDSSFTGMITSQAQNLSLFHLACPLFYL